MLNIDHQKLLLRHYVYIQAHTKITAI